MAGGPEGAGVLVPRPLGEGTKERPAVARPCVRSANAKVTAQLVSPMEVALVTWEQLPQLSDDDQELVPHLRRAGHTPTAAVWSDPAVPWSKFDGIVLRSTWDYYRRHEEFLRWVDRVGSDGRLWNPARVVRWNSHKSYLLDLEQAGVPIVPTRIAPSVREAARLARREAWSQIVVKPAVSAAGFRTYRLDLEAPSGSAPSWGEAPPEGEVLVQPYEPEVERSGERSLVFLRGEYSHGFLRAPRLAPGSKLAEEAPIVATEDERRLGLAAIAAAPGPTLYGRVDMVRDSRGTLRLMELELIEPALALRTRPPAAADFAAGIAGLLERPRPPGSAPTRG